MDSTDAADRFYRDVIVPVKQLNQRSSESYFAMAFDSSVRYWQPVTTRVDGYAKLAKDLDEEGMLRQLVEYWHSNGDRLTKAADDLVRLSKDIGKERSTESERLSDFVYPLF